MIKRVYIEILNTCNLSCAFCEKNTRSARCLTPAEFEDIIIQVKEITDYVYLHVQGEPLLHPQFTEIMTLCDQYQMHVQLVTNGTFLDRYPDLLTHPSLRRLSVSLQSIEYQSVPLSDYAETIRNLLKKAPDHPQVIYDLRFWRSDQMDRPATQAILNVLHSFGTMKPSGRPGQFILMPGVYVSFENSFTWPKEESPAGPVSGTCLGGRNQIAILSDGSVVPCCLDADAHVLLGNIFHTPLREILSSSRYTRLVQDFQNRVVREPFCITCPFRHRFDAVRTE